MNKQFKAWAIFKNGDSPDFIGKYWRFENSTNQIPVHMEGCVIAMFKTRKLAREGLESVPYPGARVVKVTVSIEIIEK